MRSIEHPPVLQNGTTVIEALFDEMKESDTCIFLNMSTIITILVEMWGEMLWVCWGMGEIMDELQVL